MEVSFWAWVAVLVGWGGADRGARVGCPASPSTREGAVLDDRDRVKPEEVTLS